MQGRVSLKEVSHPRYQWRVRWREGTKDCQRYFIRGEKEVAEQWMQKKRIELGNHGTAHGTVSDSERAALITFRDAVAKMPEPRPTLRDCVNAYLGTISNQLNPISVAELVQRRVTAAENKGVHQRTLRDLAGVDGTGGRLGQFSATFGTRQAAGISPDEIETWTNDQCATSANRREMLVRLNGLFAYGVKRGFFRENPVSRLELPRPNSARAHILDVKEAHALLVNCSPLVLPAVAVQLFAGVRHAEAERMTWADIDFDAGTVRAVQRKGVGNRREKNRFAPLTPALLAWLKGRRKLSGPVFPVATRGPRKGQISPQIYRQEFAKAREAAGLTKWDENTLRHSFGSYRTADIGDLEKVRVEMGHTTTRTTAEFYLNAVRPKDAQAFWALTPGIAPGKIVAAPRAVRKAKTTKSA